MTVCAGERYNGRDGEARRGRHGPVQQKGVLVDYEAETLRRLQLAELEILRAVDEACSQLGIPYFLDGGTALGAVRHGGFIPWDDDADVGMLRPHYERFLAEAPAVLGPRFVVASPRTHPQMAGMFAKVMLVGTAFQTRETLEAGFDQGVFVDVFPYDCLASDSRAAARQQRACRRQQSLSYLYHSKHITVPHGGVLGACERLACRAAHRLVCSATSPQAIAARFGRAAAAGATRGGTAKAGGGVLAASSASELGGLTEGQAEPMTVEGSRWATLSYAGTAFPYEVLAPARPIAFEGATLQGPAQPEAFLEALFGPTWTQLPPESQRRNHAPVHLEF